MLARTPQPQSVTETLAALRVTLSDLKPAAVQAAEIAMNEARDILAAATAAHRTFCAELRERTDGASPFGEDQRRDAMLREAVAAATAEVSRRRATLDKVRAAWRPKIDAATADALRRAGEAVAEAADLADDARAIADEIDTWRERNGVSVGDRRSASLPRRADFMHAIRRLGV